MEMLKIITGQHKEDTKNVVTLLNQMTKTINYHNILLEKEHLETERTLKVKEVVNR
ncbi:hypothetical protein [Carnobacterium funditum]|uniref:hypothetical protein n=1 Tax=Carnobacterium funditum TaxID=2752 RepID=UPI000B25BABF|nr:hypothetical protein [Carnobacterium funditum]